MAEVADKSLEEKLRYQRAIYRVHDTDDPALKEHFRGIINAYEKAHPEKTCLRASLKKNLQGRD